MDLVIVTAIMHFAITQPHSTAATLEAELKTNYCWISTAVSLSLVLSPIFLHSNKPLAEFTER